MNKKSRVVKSESNYNRWECTVSLKEWLKKADRKKELSIKDLYKMMAKITGESYIYEIDFIREKGYYVAYGDKSEYKFVLEKIKATVGIVVFYEDHYESYDYNSKLENFCEEYFYNNNSIERIFFSHSYNSYHNTYVFSCDVLNYKLKIILTYKKDLPFYKLVNNHLKVFEELFKFSSKDFEGYEQCKPRSTMKYLFKVIKAIQNQIKENVTFEVDAGVREWLRYLNGKIIGMRAMIDGNYVIISKDDIWWEENIMHYEEFRSRNDMIFDGESKRVTDTKLISRINACFQKANEMYSRFQNELN